MKKLMRITISILGLIATEVIIFNAARILLYIAHLADIT